MNAFSRLVAFIRRITPLRIAMGVALLFSGAHFIIESEIFEHGLLSKKGFIHLLDLKALDAKFQSRTSTELPEPQVVVAAIDERAIERFGRWPWSRKIVARFIDAANQGGAKVIAFDAVFSDEDKNSSYVAIKSFLDSYQTQGPSPKAMRQGRLDSHIEAAKRATGTLSQDLKTLNTLLQKSKKPTQKGEEKVQRPQDVKMDRIARRLVRASQEAERRLTQGKQAASSLNTRAEHYHTLLRDEIAARSPDQELAAALRRSKQTIMGYITYLSDDETVGLSKEELARDLEAVESAAIRTVYGEAEHVFGDTVMQTLDPIANADISKIQVRSIVGVQAPLKIFADASQHFAFFNNWPDVDGPMRRIWTFVRQDKVLFPSLSLLATALYFDADTIAPLNGDIKPGETLKGVSLDSDIQVETDMHGRMLINYYTDPSKYFPTHSIADFIDGSLDPNIYKGKVVLFGATALGTHDLRPTPFSPATPGVFIHASAIQNMIDQNYLQRYYGLALLEILAYLALGLFLGIALPKLPAWLGIVVAVGFAVGLYWVDVHWVFADGTWMLNVLPTMQAFVTVIGINVYGYLTEGREKRKIRQAFQFYLTKSVVDEMLRDTDKLKLGGERKNCTVLFSDIRGFTTISEALTPEELSQLLNEYLTPMTNLVFEYDGTLDKYMGDAVMAIFGAPVPYVDHAARGCMVALDMLDALAVLQEDWKKRDVPLLDIGIGLNTGPMSVGNMGSEVRFDYTVMGDNVNLGARLEGINKQYGTNIIISEYTWLAAKDAVHARSIDLVRVKGKKEPVEIYELMGKGKPSAAQHSIITTFESGISAYRKQDWSQAKDAFETVTHSLKVDDFAAKMYLDRIAAMQQEPPGEDWDGVFTMTTK